MDCWVIVSIYLSRFLFVLHVIKNDEREKYYYFVRVHKKRDEISMVALILHNIRLVSNVNLMFNVTYLSAKKDRTSFITFPNIASF